jgi:hypothetical protein
MKAPLITILLSCIGISLSIGQTLRISELSPQANSDTERMTLKTESHEENLFVKKEAVLTDRDIKEAFITAEHEIHVRLNDEGAQKLKTVTERLRKKGDRLAIVVEGRLITAPTVLATLDSDFVISGFDNLDLRELDALARKMSGRPPASPGDPAVPPTPKFKRVLTPKRNTRRTRPCGKRWASSTSRRSHQKMN